MAVIATALSASAALCPAAAAMVSRHQLSRTEAAALSKRITGYPEAEVVRAELQRVGAEAFPFGHPKKRLVWAITLQGITLTNGLDTTNPFIKGLRVLLEARTGSLVRIDSLPPVTGYPKHFAGREPEKELRWIALPFRSLGPPSPKVTFAQTFAGLWTPTTLPVAKQVTAYLLTLSNELGNPGYPPKAPYWVIVLGGIRAHVTEAHPAKVSTEAMSVVRAWELEEGRPSWVFGQYR